MAEDYKRKFEDLEEEFEEFQKSSRELERELEEQIEKAEQKCVLICSSAKGPFRRARLVHCMARLRLSRLCRPGCPRPPP